MIRHLFAILELAKRNDFENVYVHCFMDGRDTPPTSGEGYVARIRRKNERKRCWKNSNVYLEDFMLWIEIKDGKEFKKLMMQW